MTQVNFLTASFPIDVSFRPNYQNMKTRTETLETRVTESDLSDQNQKPNDASPYGCVSHTVCVAGPIDYKGPITKSSQSPIENLYSKRKYSTRKPLNQKITSLQNVRTSNSEKKSL